MNPCVRQQLLLRLLPPAPAESPCTGISPAEEQRSMCTSRPSSASTVPASSPDVCASSETTRVADSCTHPRYDAGDGMEIYCEIAGRDKLEAPDLSPSTGVRDTTSRAEQRVRVSWDSHTSMRAETLFPAAHPAHVTRHL